MNYKITPSTLAKIETMVNEQGLLKYCAKVELK